MGKTSLAREAARWWHRLGLRPGGAAFFSFESRQGADRAVQTLVQYVEGDKFVQGSPEELWARAVGYFRGREILWVWDNFESTLPQYQEGRDPGIAAFGEEERDRLRKLYRELTTGKPKGWLVVTCRPEDAGLPGIAEMTLGGLEKGPALEMAREILARKDLKIGAEGYERERIEELLEAVERHPLSIELVMAHLKKVKPAEAAKDLRKLVADASQEVDEEKNRSLMASLRWSTGRLSEEARGVLPYLAWFDGGAFERIIEDFCAVGPEVWGRVREELLATALVRVDDDVQLAGKPYLAFHPTLPYAAQPGDVVDSAAATRFVEVHVRLAASVARALMGAEPAAGMKVMARQERNVRMAVALAFERGEYEAGAKLAEIVRAYLEGTGRVRGQTDFARWVQERVAVASEPVKWASEHQHAWGLYLAGQEQAAVDALRALGRLVDAMNSAEKAVAISRECGDARNEAVGFGQMAKILGDQHRFREAEQFRESALRAALQAGDIGLEGLSLQHLGGLAHAQGHHAIAVGRYKEARARFQTAGDRANEMRTADLLGTAVKDLGQHQAARAWYAEAERLAREIGDEKQLGVTAHNFGILLQEEADGLPDEATDERLRILAQAAASVGTSLAIHRKRRDDVLTAASLSQLGVIHRILGSLDSSESYSQQAIIIREPLDLADVYKDYWNLEAIAVARNRPDEAATWRAKKEAKIAQLQRLAQGDGPPRLPPQARDAFVALCQALHAARSANQPLPPDAAEAVTQLAKQPDPFGAAGRFLQRIADGEIPEPPAGLPPELGEIFAALVETLRAVG